MTNSSANLELWGAIFENDLDRAQAALEAGACPNKQRGTKSMLARALEREGPDMALMLLRAGADIRSAAHGTTCWDLCVRRGWTEAMEYFVRQGMDLNVPTGGNLGFSPAGLAASTGNTAVLEWLDARGADVALAAPSSNSSERKSTISIWMERMVSADSAEDWTTLGWLSCRTLESVWRARAGEQVVRLEGKSPGFGRRALAVLLATPRWSEDEEFLQTTHNSMLQARLFDWAKEFRQLYRVPMGLPALPHIGPWTTTPLATVLMATKVEAGRPRRMAKALNLIRELVAYGADPNDTNDDLPLAFFATSKGCPPQAIEQLLDLGANPCFVSCPDTQESKTESDKISQRALLRGATLLHLAAREKYPEVIEMVGKRFPHLVAEKDPAGLSPLFRCVFPYVIWSGIVDKRPLLPSLNAFRNLGADPREETERGNGLLHALIHSRNHLNFNPEDMDEAIFFIHSWNPDTFELRQKDGTDGWTALKESGIALAGSKSSVLLAHRQMNQRLSPARPDRTPSRRF